MRLSIYGMAPESVTDTGGPAMVPEQKGFEGELRNCYQE